MTAYSFVWGHHIKGLNCAVSHANTILLSWKMAACHQLQRCNRSLGVFGTNDSFLQARKLIFAIKTAALEVLISGKSCKDAKWENSNYWTVLPEAFPCILNKPRWIGQFPLYLGEHSHIFTSHGLRGKVSVQMLLHGVLKKWVIARWKHFPNLLKTIICIHFVINLKSFSASSFVSCSECAQNTFKTKSLLFHLSGSMHRLY